MKKTITLLALFVICSNGLPGQEEEQPFFRIDSLAGDSKKVQIIGLPVAFYTPETNFGIGGGGQVFFLRRSNVQNTEHSNILVSFGYTLNNQLLIDLKPRIYLNDGNYLLDMALKYQVYPNTFWGIGNTTPDSNEEDYNMTSTVLNAAYLRHLPPTLNFGFELIYENYKVTMTEEDGILGSGEVLGEDKAVISGLGMVFQLDDRDDLASPRSGNFVEFKGRFSSRNFGATSDFNTFIIDLRTYQPLSKKSVLAFQVYSENNFGEVPFQGLAWYGGGTLARGYFRGRFMDKLLYVVQAEYRLRFHPRWVLAGFALVGEVSDLPRNFFTDLKPSVGAGIRFQFVKSQNTLLRLDFGIGKNNSSGVYFGVNEAF